jgi:hypothetical protein
MIHQRIEQLIRNAYAYGMEISAWEDSQKEKGRPVPKTLHEDSIAKLIEDNKYTIEKLYFIEVPEVKLKSETDNLKLMMENWNVKLNDDGKISITMYHKNEVLTKIFSKENSILLANCILSLKKLRLLNT